MKGRRLGMVVLGLAVGLWLSVGPALADWPQYLGPERDGIARQAKDLPRSWPASGPEVLWRVSVGVGFGGPAIYGDSVLLLDREDDARDVLRRIRLTDGEEIWRYEYDAPGKLDYNGSRSTPATDGKLVFTVGPFGHINAVKFSDGTPVWSAHLLKDWDAKIPNWGVSLSPLLLEDTVIVEPWGSKAAIVAYDKETGKVVWTTPNPAGIAQEYTSTVPMTVDGRLTLVAGGRRGHIIGIDPDTSKQLWSYTNYECRNHIPSPTIIGGGRVLLTGGYGAGSAMLKVAHSGGGYKVTELWKNKNLGSKTPQALVYKGHVYANSCDNRKGLMCMTFDGTVQWSTGRDPGFDMGNILIADGLIFIVNGKGGDLVMAEATPAGYKELGRATVLAGKEIWAPMAYSDGKLVLRDQTTLACVDLKAHAR